MIQPDTVYERVQFQFEDDAYDTVPDLITYYVGSGKPISTASGARISTPRNRLYPLSFYATKYGLQQQMGGGTPAISPIASSPLASGGTLRFNTYNSYRSPVHSPPRTKREIPPRLPSKKQRSHSLTPSEMNGRSLSLSTQSYVDDRSNSSDGVVLDSPMTRSCQEPTMNNGKFSTHSLPRGGVVSSLKVQLVSSSGTSTVPRNSKIVRVTSDPALSPCMERRRFDSYPDVKQEECETVSHDPPPPPKPIRFPSLLGSDSNIPDSDIIDDTRPGSTTTLTDIPYPVNNHGTFQRVVSYHASGSDSGNGSGDSAQSSAAGDASESTTPCSTLPLRPSGVIIKNPRYIHQGITSSCSSTTLKAFDFDSAVEDSMLMEAALRVEFPTFFDLENFQTLLLPTSENKPLDATALKGIQMMLQETGSRILANHLTRIDLELTTGSESSKPWDNEPGVGVKSGIEMAALPMGNQIRLDVIERFVSCDISLMTFH